MQVEECISFKNLLNKIKEFDICYFAYENADNGNFNDVKDKTNVAIIVGAEGGFSEEEANKLIQNGAKIVTLGKRILRCETAPLYAVSVINYLTNN